MYRESASKEDAVTRMRTTQLFIRVYDAAAELNKANVAVKLALDTVTLKEHFKFQQVELAKH